jgi:hypothetical protein
MLGLEDIEEKVKREEVKKGSSMMGDTTLARLENQFEEKVYKGDMSDAELS